MAKIKYVDKRLGEKALAVIVQANKIIEEYQAQGYDLTLRQLYYQFVARDFIPNSLREYQKLGVIINDGRLAGLIDWLAITDRTRSLKANGHWEGPHQIVEACARQYQIDKWANQPHRPEVWIEKDALIGVIENICTKLDVAYFSCRGYTSQSEMWVAAQRLKSFANEGQDLTIIHLGDHDPSGKDMSRDIQDRLDMFCGRGSVEVKRIALNMSQIEKYDPPPNPAKITDPRAKSYIAEFGQASWELDALEPQILEKLISKTILNLRDDAIWEESLALENEHKQKLEDAAETLEE